MGSIKHKNLFSPILRILYITNLFTNLLHGKNFSNFYNILIY